VRAGPGIDMRVIDKHREYLERPEHSQFLNQYLLVVYSRALQTGDRDCAAKALRELRQRHALSMAVLKMYLRHAPEFRTLHALLAVFRSWRRSSRSASSIDTFRAPPPPALDAKPGSTMRMNGTDGLGVRPTSSDASSRSELRSRI
jgi:hypothetical protein